MSNNFGEYNRDGVSYYKDDSGVEQTASGGGGYAILRDGNYSNVPTSGWNDIANFSIVATVPNVPSGTNNTTLYTVDAAAGTITILQDGYYKCEISAEVAGNAAGGVDIVAERSGGTTNPRISFDHDGFSSVTLVLNLVNTDILKLSINNNSGNAGLDVFEAMLLITKIN